MDQYTLIGHPLGHSMSPWIHERLFRMTGQEAQYTLTDIVPEALEDQVEELRKLRGFNITIPYKVDILPFLNDMDESAKLYNSVNTVAVRDGKLYGYNTDCIGCRKSIGKIKPGEQVLLIGCGGVGRMMATEAFLSGADLTLIDASHFRAESLAGELHVLQSSYSSIATGHVMSAGEVPSEGQFDLLMNATPVGMYPKVGACPVDRSVLERCGRVFDVIYNPTETQLVKWAKWMNVPAVGGSSMLVWQAVAAHQIWYGAQFEEEKIEALVKEMEAEVARLFPEEGAIR